MQHYHVIISPEAKANIREAFYFIYDQSPKNAKAWLNKIYQKITALDSMPHRCGVIRENQSFDEELRELLFYSHRIIIHVDEENSQVNILSVRHGFKDDLKGFEF